MAGSSLRNALHRRNHKERAQLVGRSRLGLLEKKKDYVQRARDYHSKQDRLHRLQEKAAMRNKDEFYFSMINSRTKGGVHVADRGNVAIPVDTVKLLKSQDENYIRTMRAQGLKKIAVLKLELSTLVNLVNPDQLDDDEDFDDSELDTLRSAGLLSTPGASTSMSSLKRKRSDEPEFTPLRGSRVVFVCDATEANAYRAAHGTQGKPSLATGPSTDAAEDEEADLGWKPVQDLVAGKKRRKSKGSLADSTGKTELDASQAQLAASKHRRLLLKELAARLERDSSLKDALLEIKNQRLRMQPGAKKLIDSTKGKGKDKSDDTGRGKKEEKGFTFNMIGSDDEGGDDDDSDDDAPRDANGKKEWKPKVFKWKFNRSR